ncbi:MAG: hypothetical protein OEY44_03050, partial [Candidatus Peregrinibacteria bacterium]|nr:hypothetical protein [Candidatus Peregrinibacteria bacterium]
VAEKEEKEENETPKAVAESQEAAPKIPKAVTFLGDSNTKAMTDGRFEKFATHEIAEGSQTIDWGLLQMGIDPEAGTLKDEVSETVKKNRQTCLNSEMINIAFGTNDTAKGDSAEDTYGKMQKLVKGLKELNPQLKIALCTVPPLELSEDLETNRNALNKKILEGAGTEYYAIDLSKKLQDPKDPTRLASDVRGDKAHYSKDTAATYLERELIEIYNQSA